MGISLWKGSSIIVVMLLLFLAIMMGCDSPAEEEEPPVVVSSKTFVEAITMGNMTVQLLRDRGYEVVDELGLGEVSVMRPAITAGEVDLYWEYTGTVLMAVMDSEAVADSHEAYQKVKEWDQEENNLVWLDYAPANNTHVIFISQELYSEKGWETISELADFVGDAQEPLRMALPTEWYERGDGLPFFEEHYEFLFDHGELQFVELGLAYEAVGRGLAEVGIGDATEGRIAQFDLVVLEDDKQFFPAYNPAPVVRQEILDIYPELADVLEELSTHLDTETLTLLNKEVAVEGRQPEDVSRDFLLEKGLIED